MCSTTLNNKLTSSNFSGRTRKRSRLVLNFKKVIPAFGSVWSLMRITCAMRRFKVTGILSVFEKKVNEKELILIRRLKDINF